MTAHPLIPQEIMDAYFAGSIRSASTLGDGMINITLLITANDGQKVVLQRLSPIFDSSMIADYSVVSEHLQKQGWEIPMLVSTIAGEGFAIDGQNRVWRALEFIESESREVSSDSPEAIRLFGGLLGKLHVSLAGLQYVPVFTLPNFHDVPYHATEMVAALPLLPTEAAKLFAGQVTAAYKALPALPDTGLQLLHGDPRTGNALQRDGKAFTFIDWDTLMSGSIWLDIGDMLRSLGENEVLAGRPVTISILQNAIEGYRLAARADFAAAEFELAALRSAQLISLDLTMRFITDYIDGDEGYFLWDDKVYASRHEHNMVRARNQWQIYEQIENFISGRVV